MEIIDMHEATVTVCQSAYSAYVQFCLLFFGIVTSGMDWDAKEIIQDSSWTCYYSFP